MFPTIFVNHGGGPMPLIGKQPDISTHLKEAMAFLSSLPEKIVVISAHWEADPISILANPQPGMFYDYNGFPPETYEYKYNAPGCPELASKIQGLLNDKGLECELDKQRGFDHGVFVPLMLMHPKVGIIDINPMNGMESCVVFTHKAWWFVSPSKQKADIPVVSVSLHASLDPEINMKIGEALAPLRKENVLIVGSGYTFHNTKNFFDPSNKAASNKFNGWLKQTLLVTDSTTDYSKLKEWESAPGARQCHPREEHLLPLLTVAGASHGSKAQLIYDTTASEESTHSVTSYMFG